MDAKKILVGAVALVVLVAGYFVYELIDTDAPDSVSTEAALEQLEAEAAKDADAAVAAVEAETAEVVDDGVFGTWVVDDEFGDFDFSSASGSFAGFRVEKSFATGQGATAVGRTGGVSGNVTISEGELSRADITVVMTEIVSDEAAREGAIKDAVQASTHPTATFTVTNTVALDTAGLKAGNTVSVPVEGELTIAGVTNAVVVPIEATVVEPGVGVIIGQADLVWADYGIETPQSSLADVADDGILEFQLIVRNS